MGAGLRRRLPPERTPRGADQPAAPDPARRDGGRLGTRTDRRHRRPGRGGPPGQQRRLFWTGFAIAVGWLAVATVPRRRRQGAGAGRPCWPARVLLVVVGGVIAVLLRRARVRVPPPPGAYPAVWGRWLYPLAAAVTVVVALTLPVIIVRGVLPAPRAAGGGGRDQRRLVRLHRQQPQRRCGARALGTDHPRDRLAPGRPQPAHRGRCPGHLLRPAAQRRRRRPARASASCWTAPPRPSVCWRRWSPSSPRPCWRSRRRFDRLRAVGVMTVVLLAVLYPYRNVIEDPTSVARSCSARRAAGVRARLARGDGGRVHLLVLDAEVSAVHPGPAVPRQHAARHHRGGVRRAGPRGGDRCRPFAAGACSATPCSATRCTSPGWSPGCGSCCTRPHGGRRAAAEPALVSDQFRRPVHPSRLVR